MKVWLIKDGEQLPIDSGSRKHRMFNLATTLAARGHEVTWWSSTHSHQNKQCHFDHDKSVQVDEGFQLRLLHAGGYPRNLSWQRLVHHNRFAWKLYREMRKLPPADAVVCCLPIVEAVLMSYIYTRRAGIPLIIDIRDPWPDVWLDRVPTVLHPLARLALSPYYFITRLAFARVEVLLSISNRWLRWGMQAGRRSPRRLDSVVVHGVNALEPSKLEDAPKIQAEVTRLREKVIFSYAGSFNRAYDLETVCRAALKLQGQPHIHFLLAGDGPRYKSLLQEFGGLTNLTFLGWLERLELNALLQQSHVGMSPYRGDMLGSKVYEYMAAGLPALVSAFGDVQDLINRTESGLTYEVGNPDDFATKALRLADDAQLRKTYSKNALAVFEAEFSATQVYGKYADIIERATEEVGKS